MKWDTVHTKVHWFIKQLFNINRGVCISCKYETSDAVYHTIIMLLCHTFAWRKDASFLLEFFSPVTNSWKQIWSVKTFNEWLLKFLMKHAYTSCSGDRINKNRITFLFRHQYMSLTFVPKLQFIRHLSLSQCWRILQINCAGLPGKSRSGTVAANTSQAGESSSSSHTDGPTSDNVVKDTAPHGPNRQTQHLINQNKGHPQHKPQLSREAHLRGDAMSIELHNDPNANGKV